MTVLLSGWGLKPHKLAWEDGSPSRIDSLLDYSGEIIWSRRELTLAAA